MTTNRNTILQRIISRKKEEVETARSLHPIEKLKDSAAFTRKIHSIKENLNNANTAAAGIIAEYKRASPSKGLINGHATVPEVVKGYTEAGVAGISVLTDRDFFQGALSDLALARETTQTPLLRKDFIIDPYQLYEAKANGADCILLIAAALEPAALRDLSLIAKDLGLEVLMEVHQLEEIENNCWESVDMIGVNNRNLHDFRVDIQHSIDLASHIPSRYPKVAESGLDQVETLYKLHQAGFDGFLMGEFFMKQENPSAAIQLFVEELQDFATRMAP